MRRMDLEKRVTHATLYGCLVAVVTVLAMFAVGKWTGSAAPAVAVLLVGVIVLAVVVEHWFPSDARAVKESVRWKRRS